VEVDDYTTLQVDDAIRRIKLVEPKYKDYSVEEVFSEEAEEGTVIRQTPAPGELVIPEDEVVKLVVSKGTSPIVLDDYQGSSIEFAQRHLATLLLEPVIQEEFHAEVSAGNIIKQDPAPESQVKKGDKIQLIVSKGPQPEDKTTDIPLEITYKPSEEGAEQKVELFVEDLNTNMDQPKETYIITEDLITSFTITVPYKQKAKYEVFVDGEKVQSVTIDYDDIE
jgi:serine/threonine-protein kinase